VKNDAPINGYLPELLRFMLISLGQFPFVITPSKVAAIQRFFASYSFAENDLSPLSFQTSVSGE
jgi:hypothetical protein